MWEKIIQLVSRKDLELKERMLRSIILVGGAATIAATIECVVVMNSSMLLYMFLGFLLVVMGVVFFVTFKYQKYELASILLGLVIVAIVFPLMFCQSGAIEGGASVWLALGILYIFIMFSGRRLYFFLALSFVVYGVSYWMTYRYPELIVPMPSRAAVYIDSFFSVIVVGLVGGSILKAHMVVFEKEHKINIQQREELKNSSNTKNAFFANMSHEIRTPINAIIGLNEMILRENVSGLTREYAQDIQMASQMLLSQVNDILDLSQVEMKKMKIIPGKYKTKELFGDLAELIRVQVDKKHLQFHLEIDQNLPSVLLGDEKRMKQILLNILDNAVKYTEEGSVTMSAQGEECEGGEIILKVKIADTGIGIRKEDIEYLYDSFNRADEKRNARIVGSGLGLAITKQLVDLMDGEITVDSIYTKGTIFTVMIKQKIVNWLPVGAVEFQEGGTKEGEFYQSSFEAPEARILVVDDNKLNSLVAMKLLSYTRMQVDVANSGMECLELTKKKFYHVILLDNMMPGMDGKETLDALRIQENGLCRDAAVIALTANAMSGAAQMYREQGFDGYVEKPIQGRKLEKEIVKFLPQEIIEYEESDGVSVEKVSQMHQLTKKKRKKVYITSDCTCDLPQELLEKYDIQLMYSYIRTPNGRYVDTREIDSDSLSQYISMESSSAYAESVKVEEYEEFFAELLTQAEQVIHITVASRSGESYHKAMRAISCFDHVRIIDSGQISCGQGLLVLYAAKLAMGGKSATEICEAVEKIKNKVQTRFIMPGADIFYQNGRIPAVTAKICKVLHLHPFIAMRQKKEVVTGLLAGSLENSWRQGITWHLLKRWKINRKIVFITHVGCSVKQQEWIKNEVLKHISFEQVIIQNASFTNACNVGMETIGISYFNQ